jgi:uncharacterized membrane protein
MRLQILFAALGLLLIVIGRPLARRRIGPNRWYGLRVPATFADEKVWYEANAAMGRDLIALGVLLAVLAFAVPPLTGLRDRSFAITFAIFAAAASLVVSVRGWRLAIRLSRSAASLPRK